LRAPCRMERPIMSSSRASTMRQFRITSSPI